MQQLGSCSTGEAVALIDKGVNLVPVTVVEDQFGFDFNFMKLLEMENPPDLHDPKYAQTGMVFYRSDDWAATSYFYLDKPSNDLPAIAPVEERIYGLINE